MIIEKRGERNQPESIEEEMVDRPTRYLNNTPSGGENENKTEGDRDGIFREGVQVSGRETDVVGGSRAIFTVPHRNTRHT